MSVDILYHGEAWLIGWGETPTAGKFLKLRLADQDSDPLEFCRGLGKSGDYLLNATISVGDIETDNIEPEKGTYGDYAASLYRSGFFYAPKVAAALGTDKEYRHWIQQQPSAHSGEFSEYVNGEGRCIAAHVRRAGEAGTGYKPLYSCIPLTNDEHMAQHQHGEKSLEGLDWEGKRQVYLVKWVKSRLYDLFSVDSLTKINPGLLKTWAENNDLSPYLPRAYK